MKYQKLKTLVLSSFLILTLFQTLFGEELNKPYLPSPHLYGVNSMAISPDGKMLATASIYRTIKLWDMKSGRELIAFTQDKDFIQLITFSYDSSKFIAITEENIKYYDMKSGKLVKKISLKDTYRYAISPDKKTIAATMSKGNIKLIDVESGKTLQTLKKDDSYLETLAFSPDGTKLIATDEFEVIHIWNPKKAKLLKSLQVTKIIQYIKSVAINPDGKTLALGGDNGVIKLIDIKSGKEIRGYQEQTKFHIQSLAFSIGGRLILSKSSFSPVKLWSVESEFYLGEFEGVSSFSFLSDNKTIALGNENGTVTLYDFTKGETVQTFGAKRESLLNPLLSPDETILASGGEDGSIKLLDIKSLKEIGRLKSDNGLVSAILFSDDGKTLFSGSLDGTIKLWDMETQKEIKTLARDGDIITSLTLSKDGKTLLITSRDKKIIVLDIENGNVVHTLTGHKESVEFATFNNDETMIISMDSEGNVKYWDAKNGKLQTTLENKKYAMLNPDESMMVFSSDYETATLLDTKSGKKLFDFSKKNGRQITTYSFSPDGKTLFIGDEDNTLTLVDIKTKKELKTFKGYWIMKLIQDGKILIAKGFDDSIIYFDLSSKKELFSIHCFADGESVAISPEGYFTLSSKEALKYINIRKMPMSVEAIDDGDYKRFYKEDLVSIKLKGEEGKKR